VQGSKGKGLLANVGPTTATLEALASLIGAGLIVGGFAGGLVSLLCGDPRSEIEQAALNGGYLGGAFGLVLLAVDILEKHFV
jgi:hypothetical protein